MHTEPSNQRLRAVFIVGTRPEAIKMLPLIVAMRDSTHFEPVVVSTGQHAEMVAAVLSIGDIRPDVEFELPTGPRSLNDLFAFILTHLEDYLGERFGPPLPPAEASYENGYPAACFVHGDTTSAAAAALAAFHLHLPVVHVEAGLRTSNTLSPFPEELNRQLISRIAALHLAPTNRNKANLMSEGVPFGRVFITGNTAIDALHLAASDDTRFEDARLADLDAAHPPRVVVVTAHRRENWGRPLERVADAVAQSAQEYPDVRFIVALHPNPAVSGILTSRLADCPNVTLVAAMKYVEFAHLLKLATLAITDSGGIQEEAPALGTPVICVRETTERQEGVDAGTVELVGTSTERITAAVRSLLDDPDELRRRSRKANPYGDGNASVRIVRALEHIIFNAPAPAPFGPGFERNTVLAAGGSDDPAESGWVASWPLPAEDG